MTSTAAASGHTAVQDPVRSLLHSIAQQHRNWTADGLSEQLEVLHKQAEISGFFLTSGLAASFVQTLAREADRLCASPYLTYMLRALTLEPCSDRDILRLLLAGIRRRVDELRQMPGLNRPSVFLLPEGIAPTAAPGRPQLPQRSGVAPEPTPGTPPPCR